MEKTFILFKPDAMQRAVVGELVARLEKKGLKLVACKLLQLDDKVLEIHYAHLKAKPFFPVLSAFMKESPCLATVWEGQEAVKVVRDLVGVTNSRNASAGTIRGDYGISMQKNLIHASDSIETAEAEVKRFFKKEEVMEWKNPGDELKYAPEELD